MLAKRGWWICLILEEARPLEVDPPAFRAEAATAELMASSLATEYEGRKGGEREEKSGERRGEEGGDVSYFTEKITSQQNRRVGLDHVRCYLNRVMFRGRSVSCSNMDVGMSMIMRVHMMCGRIVCVGCIAL